jgi:acetolactate synthase-1/2/3 large subunit
MTNITVAKVVIQSLRDLGVKHIFGVPSGGWVDYMEAIRQTDGIDFVLTSHEGGAGFMAAVTGRLSTAPGVCFGTFGPGATNLSTGVGCAQLDRSALIALTDEMPAKMRSKVTQMGIDHQALFAPITKKTTRLAAIEAQSTIKDATRLAVSEKPGSVHIGIPVDVTAQNASYETLSKIEPETLAAASDTAISQMLKAFEESEKPVIAVGLAAVRAGIKPQLIALAEKFNVPVVLTPMAKGMLPETHKCYAGVLFHALSDQVGITHQQADLIVAIGYDPVEFNLENWVTPSAAVLNIDVIPTDLDTGTYRLLADVVGDIAHSVEKLQGSNCTAKQWDMDALAVRRNDMFEAMRPESDTFGPCAALDALREVLPEDGIMACDVGAHTHLIGQKWPTPEPNLQIMSNGWSSMGYGLCAAVAAKLCKPKTPVCCVVGDGGFLMNAGELATAVREQLPIVIVVLTDNDLALIRIKQEKKDNPIYGTPVRAKGAIGGPDLFGVPVTTVDNPASFKTALQKAFQADGPVIVEALISSQEYDHLVLKKDKP